MRILLCLLGVFSVISTLIALTCSMVSSHQSQIEEALDAKFESVV